MSYVCPHCNSFSMADYVWWVSGGKSTQSGGVRSVEKIVTGGHQTGWCKQAKGLTKPRSSKRTQYLTNALKLLANQQEDGNGFTQNIVTNLCEVSRKGLTEG